MKHLETQKLLDRWSIAASTLCAVHCLFSPVLIVLVPALASTVLADETFHRFMLLWVVPTSGVALWIGCRHHKDANVLLLGVAGLAVLAATTVWGQALLAEPAEKAATIAGSLLMSAGHWRNYRLCRGAACEHR